MSEKKATHGSGGAQLTNAPEEAYTASVSATHRKNFGQFFTPPAIAEVMAQWVTGNPSCRTILDPATGLGIFFRTIEKIKPQNSYQFVGYDIDPTILGEAKSLLPNSPRSEFEFRRGDYLFTDWQTKYDAIICNPPYFKFQDYQNRARALREFQTRLNIKLSGLTNTYALFLLKALHQLTFQGRAAFLVPFEFLNAKYGTIIKKRLLESKALKFVILFDAQENVFTDALTTSCILLLANDQRRETVSFIDAARTAHLTQTAAQIGAYPHETGVGRVIPYSDLDPAVKWRAYYRKETGGRFKNLAPLSVYGKVVRGIATGANDYFTFDSQKQKEFSIKDKFLLPCLTKARQAPTNFFTRNDFEKLRLKGSRVFILNAFDLTDKAVKEYVELGEKLKVNERYLTKHRTPWHTIENRPPAPLLVTVFTRGGWRFVRNEAGVRNLTCFHCIYLNQFAAVKVELLMAYFLSEAAQEILNDERREYGGGLHKFEPNDLNQAKVVDVAAIDAKTEEVILKAYESYRESVLVSAPNRAALQTINETFAAIIKAA